MQSITDEPTAELEAYDIQERHPTNFELYEKYSKRTIADTIRICRENFNKADVEAKRELLTEVEREVENFSAWLEKTKNLEPTAAHYYSVSVKSLLLGVPTGVETARLFGTILDTKLESNAPLQK